MEEKYKNLPFTDFQVTFHVEIEGDRIFCSTGVSHSSPTPFSIYGIWVIPPGLPIGSYEIAKPGNVRPHPSAISVAIAADQLSMWARRCPKCAGYWRTEAPGLIAPAVCPYCGQHAEAFQCLSKAQMNYVEAVCEAYQSVIGQNKSGNFGICAEKLLDQYHKLKSPDTSAPPEFFVEISQQTTFLCEECGSKNNILGRFGYCSTCGTRNDIDMLRADIENVRKTMINNTPSLALKELVSLFDSFGRRISKELVSHVRMNATRQTKWGKANFTQLRPITDGLQRDFDISLMKNVSDIDRDHAEKMFHRRHVHEHLGSIIDAKYISDSGDTTVKDGELIDEKPEDVMRLAAIINKIAVNFMRGFHEIIPVHQKPIEHHKSRKATSRR